METKKASLVLVLLLMIGAFSFTVTFLPRNVKGGWHFVGGTGLGNYSTIGEAIIIALPGDSIYVYSGTYREWVGISKPLTLVGEDMNTTIIDNEGSEVMAIQSDWVNVTGFTVTNATFFEEDGILLRYVENCSITYVNASNNYYGIHVFQSSNNTIAHNVVLFNYLNGIFLDMSNDNTVEDNFLFGQTYNGIAVGNSDRNIIRKNNASSNGSEGISSYNSFHNEMSGNWVESNVFGGIRIGGGHNTVANNTLLHNVGGISVSSEHNMVLGNELYSNDYTGIYLIESNNTVIGNTVVNHSSGIRVQYSINERISNNVMTENGIVITGTELEYWNTHLIDTTNTVNGKPVYYWKNQTGGSVPSDAGQVILGNCSHVIVQNQNVSKGSIGIQLGYSSNNTMANNTILSNKWYGIDLDSSSNNRIVNNTISTNNRGMALYESNNNTISNNTLLDNLWIGIGIYQSTHSTLRDNTLVRNGIAVGGDFLENWNTHIIDTTNTVNYKPVRYWKNTTGGTVPLGAGQVILANCTDILIEHQNASNRSGGIGLGFSSSIRILNNTAYSVQGSGIHLYVSNFSTIADNKIQSSDDSGVYMHYASNNTIVHNEAVGNDGNGISLGSLSNHNTITWNVLSDNEYSGLRLTYASNNSISNNAISRNSEGIELWYYNSANTIVNNTVSNNDDGIHFERNNAGNEIVRNTILENVNGIDFLADNTDNDINNNTVSDNDCGIVFNWYNNNGNLVINNTVLSNTLYGIQLVRSEFNEIYHNNFIDNERQAFDDSDTNQWDNGYPSGGNYWSNYSGVDMFWGPAQDQPGSDDIGDTPFIIDVDSQDEYPHMFPFGSMRPRPPTLMGAVLSGGGLENITLKWSLSPDDGIGFRNVAGYDIYKSVTYSPEGSGYGFIVSLPNGTSEFVDYMAGEGDPNNYFYQVCAIDLYSNRSCAQDQAAKFTRSLGKGPNLASVPLIQSDSRIETTLQTVSFDKAWFYDNVMGEWRSFMTSKPYFGDFGTVHHTMGFWVNVTENSNLTVAGIVPLVTTMNLGEGWNLVGIPSFGVDYTVADLKIAMSVERVEGFDGLAPPYHLKLLQETDPLSVVHGYWVKVTKDSSWTISNE